MEFVILITNMDDELMYGSDGESFLYDPSPQKLKAGEANVYPIKIFPPSKSGTYLYKLTIQLPEETTTTGSVWTNTAGSGGASYGTQITITDENTIYTQKSFFLEVR
jgi:hypothetical protein